MATLFDNGTIWLGADRRPSDALLVVDGVIAAVGADDVAKRLPAETDVDHVDLEGGFLMPSFGDGHAHPIFGGLEAEGPEVRGCESVEEIIAEAVRAVDAAGFQIHIHAIGDAAVRQALDAIEQAIEANGPRDRRPVIAHAQLVEATDLERFTRLGVIANMQPLWAQLDGLMTVLTVPRLGEERARQQYRMRTILDDGGLLAFGSDWPCSSGTPLEGLAVATSRQTEDGDPDGGWTPEEIVDTARALDAYTATVAHQAFADLTPAPWGRIRPGARADLVHLDADPSKSHGWALADLRIRTTYLGGVAVHS
ncbi:amidohydrolase family protein [Brevibacterium sanguinis]|uniref:Amidohydrolase family protein n=2 Tax=Brevibacterium TaxID=1696 RepID=A0A366IN79_9MICO|nr:MULTISPECIES: amidohydrolase family protein [Brevibacterium]RBP68055.1 amidohydrolase family protein [Brevibacterium sanguinis]RBP74528.1 amidohydrolase family protein [Brevibacterium celere]